MAQEPRSVPAARDAAGGARQYRAGGQTNRISDARDAAVRLHDEHLAPVPCRLEPLFEAAEVNGQRWADVGIDHRGAEALVLLDLGQHLGRQRHVDTGQETLEGAARRLLVARIGVGVEIADGDRADPHALEPRDGTLERAAIERRGDLAVEAHALLHAKPAAAGGEGDRRRHAQVVAVVLESLAHLDDVAVALRGSRSALVATVVPWTMRSVAASSARASMPSSAARSPRPSITPIEGSSGVEVDFAITTRPSGATATRSVKVPPTSMPIRYTSASPALLGARAVLPRDESVLDVRGASGGSPP